MLLTTNADAAATIASLIATLQQAVQPRLAGYGEIPKGASLPEVPDAPSLRTVTDPSQTENHDTSWAPYGGGIWDRSKAIENFAKAAEVLEQVAPRAYRPYAEGYYEKSDGTRDQFPYPRLKHSDNQEPPAPGETARLYLDGTYVGLAFATLEDNGILNQANLQTIKEALKNPDNAALRDQMEQTLALQAHMSPETFRHTIGVVSSTLAMMQACEHESQNGFNVPDYPEGWQFAAFAAALEHDGKGKIAVRNDILHASRKFNDTELAMMNAHAGTAAQYVEYLEDAGVIPDKLTAAFMYAGAAFHHYDPDSPTRPRDVYDAEAHTKRQQREEAANISPEMGAFFISVLRYADCFDAMTKWRGYKPPMPLEKVLRILERVVN